MRFSPLLLGLPVAFGAVNADDTPLATFDGSDVLTFNWMDMNDPVMGGASTSTFEIDESASTSVFNGTCAIVPSLAAPGFSKAYTIHPLIGEAEFNDVSAHINGSLILKVRSTTPGYAGFKVAFSAVGIPVVGTHEPYGTFKAPFTVPESTSTDEVQAVRVPFNTFSYDWSEYTGECDTVDPTGQEHHCCTADDDFKYCPTAEHLALITGLEVWAEGVEGSFHLETMWIGAGDDDAAQL